MMRRGRLHTKRSLAALIAAALLVCILLPRVFSLVARSLVIDEAPQRSDALIVLLGAKNLERVRKAIDLYREGFAPLIVFGSGFSWGDEAWGSAPRWSPAGQRYKSALEKAGVPPEHMLMVDTRSAHDTASELLAIVRVLRARGVRSVLLVSSATHTRRVRFISSRIAPDMRAITVAAPAPRLDSWWKSSHGRRAVLREYAGFIKELGRRLKDRVSCMH